MAAPLRGHWALGPRSPSGALGDSGTGLAGPEHGGRPAADSRGGGPGLQRLLWRGAGPTPRRPWERGVGTWAGGKGLPISKELGALFLDLF